MSEREGTVTQAIRADFSGLQDWLSLSVTELTKQQESLNAINVFPVPDGDTGTNLVATMRTVHQAITEAEPTGDLGHHLATAARQALGSAQGNSGSLVSVFLLGMGESLAGITTLTAPALAESLEAGRLRAWAALSEPVGGTILSVMEAASDAARARASQQKQRGHQKQSVPQGTVPQRTVPQRKRQLTGPETEPAALIGTLEDAWRAALREAEHTQARLKDLTDVAVVDAGAVGFAIILNCLLAAVTHTAVDPEPYRDLPGYHDQGEIRIEQVEAADGVEVVCTVTASALDAALMRAALDAVGDSVVMSAMEPVSEHDPEYRGYNHANPSQQAATSEHTLSWRVHVHVPTETTALEIISKAGEPTDIAVTPLQHLAKHNPTRPHTAGQSSQGCNHAGTNHL